jgi:antitoxin component YwqK of YwqJK toxin-antitoxin module
MHGVMKEWWENGQQSAETNFDHGQRHGLNRYWDMKGKQTKEQIYDHDKSISEKHL